MLEKIITLDKHLFLFLNNLGSPQYDKFWLLTTKQINWIPFFLLLLFLVYKKLKQKDILLLLLTVIIILIFTDQTCNLFKNSVQRLRPCNNVDFVGIMRNIKPSLTFSFFSGHAANSSAISVFLYLVLRQHYKYFGFIIFWPLIFAYSRIYLGLHYPLDILAGYLCGIIFGILAYNLYELMKVKLPLLSKSKNS